MSKKAIYNQIPSKKLGKDYNPEASRDKNWNVKER